MADEHGPWEKYASQSEEHGPWEKYAHPSEAEQVKAGLPGVSPRFPKVEEDHSGNLNRILTGPPLMSMQPGLPAAAQVPENQRAMEIGSAVGMPVGGLIAGGTAALPVIAKSIAGSSGGAYLGSRALSPFGKRAEQVGSVLGGLAGGFLGGRGLKIPGSWGEFLEGMAEKPTTAEPAPIPEVKAPAVPSRNTKEIADIANDYLKELAAKRTTIPAEPVSFAGPKALKNSPFPQAEPTRFAGPKPSANKLAEGIANKLTGVEEPPKAPAGQPLRFPGPKTESPKPSFNGPKEAPKETNNPFEREYGSEEERKLSHGGEYEKWKPVGRVELRQMLIDAGEDMGDKIVSDAKMLGPGAISRREAIQILTKKGIVPPSK